MFTHAHCANVMHSTHCTFAQCVQFETAADWDGWSTITGAILGNCINCKILRFVAVMMILIMVRRMTAMIMVMIRMKMKMMAMIMVMIRMRMKMNMMSMFNAP